MTLGEKIRTLRKEAGLSQETLAEQLGVSRQAVSKWENDSGMPETEKLINMAKLFDTSLDALIAEDDLAPQQPADDSLLPEPTELETMEGYLSFRNQRCQLIGLAVLLLIASLGLTYFFSTFVMILWMFIDIVAIALLILVVTADNPYQSLHSQQPSLAPDTLETLKARYAGEKKRLQAELFVGILCIGIGLFLAPLLFSVNRPLLDDLALACGMVLTGFGAALCIFSAGHIRAYRHLLGDHLPIPKE